MICTITTNSTIFSMFTMRNTGKIKKLHTIQSQQFSDKKTPTLIKTKTKLLDQTKEKKIQQLILKKNQPTDIENEIHHNIDTIDHPYAIYLYWQSHNKKLQKKE
jgi:hypothetical protein